MLHDSRYIAYIKYRAHSCIDKWIHHLDYYTLANFQFVGCASAEPIREASRRRQFQQRNVDEHCFKKTCSGCARVGQVQEGGQSHTSISTETPL